MLNNNWRLGPKAENMMLAECVFQNQIEKAEILLARSMPTLGQLSLACRWRVASSAATRSMIKPAGELDHDCHQPHLA
jgi:hypothetical protein